MGSFALSRLMTWSDPLKCTFEILDESIRSASYGLKVNVFGTDSQMPKILGARDAVLIRKAKVSPFLAGENWY